MTGKVSRMFYIAAVNALKDAGLTETANLPVISATGMGEVDGIVEQLSQIHESKGEILSPTLVQNTVLNAPASLMSIGLKKTKPVITVAHSLLSIEAALDYAFTLFQTTDNNTILLVGGEQYNPEWPEKLKELGQGQFSRNLQEQKFQEGSIALVLTSRDNNSSKFYAKIMAADVFHFIPVSENKSISLADPFFSKLIREKYGIKPETNTQIYIKKYCADRFVSISELSRELNIDKNRIAYSSSSFSSPLLEIMESSKNAEKNEYVYFSNEYNDFAIVHWQNY